MNCFTNICINLFVIVLAVHIKITIAQFNKPWNDKYENNKCPKLYPKNFVNYAPVGNLTAGNYSEKTSLKGLRQCVMTCCLADSCNIVFIYDSRCFHVECVSNELCLPLLRVGSHKWESHVSMILVKPVLPNENWSDILEQTNYREVNNNLPPDEDSTLYSPYTSRRNDLIPDDEDSNYLSRFINNLPTMDDDDRGYDKYRDNNDSDMIMDATTFLDKETCDIGTDDCPMNSECIPIGLKLNRGVCKCVPGTEEDAQGNCVQTLRPFSKGPTSPMDAIMKSGELTSDPKTDDLKTETTSPKTIQKLTVSVVSKEVQLPENEVTLSAYTIPNEKEAQSRYRYVWTLVDQPKDKFTGNMNQNGATVTLTDLTEGQYRFKVSVNGTNAYGEGFANVTVLPRQRVNSAPIAVITPQAQTVKLPNTGAVLDGSLSKDDVKIISYHWELTSGPIGYQPPLQDGATLELKDLKLPGNYTFKLTVEDSDNVKNSTTANITVLNHTDYPPEANAGQDVILYLPNNNLTLNGSLSTDDHEIVSWEWTKAAEDENKAVDMQNTHSPYLQLSNLSEGVYTFVLKVTDSSGQSSTAEVHVFVKPPTHTPPIADAGDQISISLPQTWAILNGTKSHGESALVSYTWRYVSGPSTPSLRPLANATETPANFTASLSGATASIANATALTKGQYVFELTVLDDNGNTNAANVTVNVAQNANMPPVANAGGDQVLSLPLAVLTLNGSRSSDDFRIVAWRWRRAPLGLAAGTIILHSDTQPVLMLTDIEPGRYVFELTVSDDQGSSSSDTVSVQVKPDPLEPYLLELTLNSPVAAFTQAQLDALVQKTTLLLKGIEMNVTQVRGELDSGNTQLIFFLKENDAPVEGTRALSLAREALRAGVGVSAGAARVRTLHCISTCSGRGSCDRATRSCRCDAFWMQSLFTLLDPDAQPDCDWSVVYASVGGVAALCGVGGACWACARLARRTCGAARRAERRPHRRATSYRLLPRADHDTLLSNKEISETETDSDVLFECKSKSTSFSRSLNGSAAQHEASNAWTNNGFNSTRKLKT